MPLPNPSMNFTPFDVLTAAELDDLVENDQALAAGTGLDTGAIKPIHLASDQSSSTWAWQSWTPTFANLTVGNGVNTSKYLKIGTTVFWRIEFDFGTTSAMGTSPTFTLPFTAHSGVTITSPIGTGAFYNGSGAANAWARLATTTTADMLRWDANNDLGGVTASFPFVWGSTSVILLHGFYEAA